MFFIIGISLLFFLPWLEGDLRTYGFILLLFSAGLIGFFSKQKNILFDKIDFLFLTFLIFAAISTIVSQGITRSFLETLRYSAYFIVFINLRRLVDPELNKIKTLYVLAILINSLLLALVSWSFFLPWRLFTIPSSGMNLYYPVFGHNRLSDLLLLSIPLLFFLVLDCKKRTRRSYILSTLFIFLSVTFIFTLSKSGYLTIIFIFLLISFFVEKIGLNAQVVKILLMILVIPVFLAFIFVIFNTYFLKIKERPFYSRINKPLYLDWRWDYYRIALQGLRESPIFGVGLDNFRYLSKKYQAKPASWSDYGENYYFTLFAETGILGGIIFMFLLFRLLWQSNENITHGSNLISMGIYFALISSAVHAFFSDDWYFLSIFMYFFAGLALLLPLPASEYKNNILIKFASLFLICFSFVYLSGLVLFNYGISQKNSKMVNISGFLTFFGYEQQLKIGKWFKDKKDYQSALNYFEKAKRLEPQDTESYLLTGELMLKLGNREGAIENYMKAESYNPLDLKGYGKKLRK